MKILMKRYVWLWMALVLAGASAFGLSPTTNAPARIVVPDYYGDIARRLARRLPHEHFLRLPMDDVISAAAWTNFVNALDFDHMYFTGADIEQFRSQEFTMDDSLEEGDMKGAYDIFEIFRERVKNRTEFVADMLSKPIDLTVHETYHWQRKDAPWAADDAEWNELWRKKVKNEYVHQCVRRIKEAEAATNTASLHETALSNDVHTLVVPVPLEKVTTNAMVISNGETVAHVDLANTNVPVPQTIVSTNLPATPVAVASTNAVATTNALPSPEEVVLKGYKQFEDMIFDCDAEWVLEKYLSAFTHAYDPHSDFMSEGEMKEFEIEMNLSLEGIGALLTSEDGAAEIVSLIPGGPADMDKRDIHLQPGDRIVSVAEEGKPTVDILHLPLREIVKKIRGPKGSRVILTVVPAKDPSGVTTKQVDLVRDQVKLENQAASWKLHEVPVKGGTPRRVAVLTLPAFYGSMNSESVDDAGYRSSTYDVARLLQEIQTNDVDGLILDLRNNGGGALDEAVNMTGLFIPSGPVVQVKEGRFMGRTYSDPDPSTLYSGPMIVLVSRLSASASEILAAALQDYGRAIVVGDSKTHGKGSVQTIQAISRNPRDGDIKVTNAAYYRISGRSTQLAGVLSDIVVSSPYDMMKLGEDFLFRPLKCEPVDPAPYKPLADLKPTINTLKEKSIARRKADPDYQAYEHILERVKQVQDNEELPLDLESRKELASMEDKVDSLQPEESDDAAKSEKKDEPAKVPTETIKDLVLREALNVMSDYVSMGDAQEAAPVPVISSPVSSTGPLAPDMAPWSARIRFLIREMTL